MKLFLGVGVTMAAVLAACSSDSSSNTGSPAVVGGDAGSAGSSAGSAGSSNAGAGGSTAGAAGTGTTGGSGGGNTFGGGGSSGSGTAGKGGSGTAGSGTGGSTGGDCSTMTAAACQQCCDDTTNMGLSKANSFIVNACGCATGQVCSTECTETCTTKSLKQECVDCLNKKLTDTDKCLTTFQNSCKADPDCVAGVTCVNKCPM